MDTFDSYQKCVKDPPANHHTLPGGIIKISSWLARKDSLEMERAMGNSWVLSSSFW